MKKTLFIYLTSAVLSGIGGVAIAQETNQTTPPTIQPDNLSTAANPLQGTTSLNSNILGNGVQFNNGLSNFPTCNQRVCGYIQHKTSPSGNESIVGLTFQIGGSADDTRAESEKAKVAIEHMKGERDYLMQLREKLASAIEEGKTTRANIFAIALAQSEGFHDHIEYLRAITKPINIRPKTIINTNSSKLFLQKAVAKP